MTVQRTGFKDLVVLVGDYYQVSPAEIMSTFRYTDAAKCRQIVMYCAYEWMAWSYPRIGRELDRDHTTVLHAVKKIRSLLKTDLSLRGNLAELERKWLEAELPATAVGDGWIGGCA